MFIKQFLKVCITGVVLLAAFILMVAPKAVAKVDQNVEGMHDITSTLKEKPKTWAEIVKPQLARKEEQEKKRIEEEKQKAAEEARRQAEAVIPQQAVVVSTPSPSPGGSKEAWMTAAGIPQNLWGYVDSIVSRESGWNPNAVNRSSGACGLGQQLPCGKWAGAWNDPVAALVAMTGYVNARYGGWPGAVGFWNSRHWY